jgi:hypothetical protein
MGTTPSRLPGDGSSASGQHDEGIITVVPATARPGGSGKSSDGTHHPPAGGPASSTSTAGQQQEDPLVQHLQALRAKLPAMQAHLAKQQQQAGQDHLRLILSDLESAQQQGASSERLSEAGRDLLGAYVEWHQEMSSAICMNQVCVS